MGSLRAIRPATSAAPEAGSGDGFEGLYRRHYPVIQRYVRRRLGDPHAVEDVVAETFLVAYQDWSRYEERGKPVQAWLYRLATSRIARHLRKHRPRTGGDLEPADERSELAPRDRQQERRDLVREALAELPPRQQEVLALHHVEGLALIAVAAILRCRVGTVKSRLHRARRALRSVLERMEWTA